MTGVSGWAGRKHGQSGEKVGKCGRKWGWGGDGEKVQNLTASQGTLDLPM